MPVTVVPATALAGRAIVVLMSVRVAVIKALLELLASVVSGTVLPLALAVTVAPLVPTKTLIGTAVLVFGPTEVTTVVAEPLMVMVEVKVVATLVALL